MRVVALEEHFNVPALVKSIDPAAIKRRGYHAAADAQRSAKSRCSSCPRWANRA